MQHETNGKSRVSGAMAKTPVGIEVNRLASTVEVVSEQPYANRERRRHARTENGAVVNIPKAKRQQALNEPYRKPAVS